MTDGTDVGSRDDERVQLESGSDSNMSQSRGERGVTNAVVALAAAGVIVVAGGFGYLIRGGGSGDSNPTSRVAATSAPTSTRATSTTRRTTTTVARTTTTRKPVPVTVAPTSPPPQIIVVVPPPPTTQPPEVHTLTGTVLISEGGGYGYVGPDCGNSYRVALTDMTTGAPVTVRDGGGVIIATGAIGAGTWTNIHNDATTPGFTYADCLLHFSVPSVPRSDFYTVEISHRGPQSYSYQQLVDKGWNVSGLSLILP